MSTTTVSAPSVVAPAAKHSIKWGWLAVAKGDFVIVPENTGHWFSEIKSTLVLMSVHVPRPVPAGQ